MNNLIDTAYLTACLYGLLALLALAVFAWLVAWLWANPRRDASEYARRNADAQLRRLRREQQQPQRDDRASENDDEPTPDGEPRTVTEDTAYIVSDLLALPPLNYGSGSPAEIVAAVQTFYLMRMERMSGDDTPRSGRDTERDTEAHHD